MPAERIVVKRCEPDDAGLIHALTQSAYKADAGFFDHPSGAMRESVDTLRADLESNGGAIAWSGDEAVGCLRFDVQADHAHLRRVAPARKKTRCRHQKARHSAAQSLSSS